MSIRVWVPLSIGMVVGGVIVAFALSRDRTSTAGGPTASPPVAAQEPSPIEPPSAAQPETPDPTATETTPALVVRGRLVEWTTGAPVADAQVEIRRTPSYLTPLVAQTASDAHGQFELSGDPPRRAAGAVHARRDGFLPWCSGRLARDSAEVELGTVRLVPAASIVGRVLAADGSPLPEFRVVAILEPSAVAALGEEAAAYRHGIPYLTDVDGGFVAQAIGGSVRLVVETPSGTPIDTGPIALPEREEITIRLPPENDWQFLVRDIDGAPIRDAELSAAGRGTAVTLADGLLRFTDERAELPEVRIVHREHEPLELGTVEHVAGVIEVSLLPARWLLLDLADEDGAPLARKVVRIRFGTGDAPLIPQDRRYRTAPLPVHTAQGTILVDGYAPASVSWAPGRGELDVGTIFLERGTRLLVEVRDHRGFPLPGAAVRLHAASQEAREELRTAGVILTDESGIARFGGLPSRPLRVLVEHSEHVSWSGDAVPIPGTETRVEARLGLGGLLTGIVLASDGTPVGLARVAARIERGSHPGNSPQVVAERHLSTSSSPDGAFALAGIASGGAVVLRVQAPGHPPVEITLDPFTPGETRELAEPIVFDLGATLRGTVRDPAGGPIAGATIALIGGGRPGGGSVRCDEAGAYEIAGIPDGSYRPLAQARGYLPYESNSEIELRGGDAVTHDFILELGGTYRARVMSSWGPIPGISGRVSIPGVDHADRSLAIPPHAIASATSDDEGWIEFIGIPPGPIECNLDYAGGGEFSVRAPSAEALPATIELPAGSRIEIAVTTADGNDLPRRIRIDYTVLERGPPGAEVPGARRHLGSGMRNQELQGGIADFGYHPEGRITVTISADGFVATAPITIDIGARAVERVEVSLERVRE